MASKSSRPTPPTTKPAAPRTAARTTSHKAPNHDPGKPDADAPCAELIRARAYYLWEQAGRPDGDGMQFWLEAEREQLSPS